MKNILTLDIEDWYQSSLDILGPEHAEVPRPVIPSKRVMTNTHRLLRILAEHGLNATCFFLGTVAETYPELVRKIHNAGHEVATHGYGHELVYKLTQNQFRNDLQHSIDLLQGITEEKVCGYRAPYFSITKEAEWALKVLVKLDIEYDSSIFPIRRKLYGFPGWNRFPHTVHTAAGNLREFPISTISLMGQNIPVGGGGYFRILPYFLIKQAIRAINRRGQPAVFYLHPYEMDTEELSHPLPGETWRTRFIRLGQTFNRGKTEAKLRRLLTDFKWTSVREWMLEQK